MRLLTPAFCTKLLMKTDNSGNTVIGSLLNIAKGVNNGNHWYSSNDRWRNSSWHRSSKEARRTIIFIVLPAIVMTIAALRGNSFFSSGDIYAC